MKKIEDNELRKFPQIVREYMTGREEGGHTRGKETRFQRRAYFYRLDFDA